MAVRDQSLRKNWIDAKDVVAKEEIAKEIRSNEIACTKRLQEMIREPGLAACEDILEVAQLVLRSSDLNFQKEALDIILKLEDESWKKWIPLLTDRILLRQNLPQRYGTHLHLNDGSCLPYPVENEDRVDFLRKEFGELPLQRYIKQTKRDIAAVEKGDRQYFQKRSCIQNNNVDDDPDNYLYYVALEIEYEYMSENLESPQVYLKRGMSPKITVAFEHPTYAAMYALHKLGLQYEIGEMSKIESDKDDETTANPPISYKIINKGLCVPWGLGIPLLGEMEPFYNSCLVFLVSRKAFQPHEYEDFFCKKIFMAEQNVEPVYTFKYSSILDPLAWLEHEIQVKECYGGGCSLKYEFGVRSIHCHLLFDITLENEDFFEK
jgi:hypothetical protein